MNSLGNKYFNSFAIIPAMLTFWIAGYFFFPTNKLHYQTFIVIFVLGSLWLGYHRRIDWQSFFSSKLILAVTVFSAYFLASLFWAFGTSFNDRLSEVKSVVYLFCFALVFSFSMEQSPKYLGRLLRTLLLVSSIALVINMFAFFVIHEHSLSARFHGVGRLWSPLWMGAIYGAITVILVGFLSHEELTRKYKLLLAAMLPMMFIGVLATHSRMAILATLLVSFLVFLMGKNSLKCKVVTIVSAAILLLGTFWICLPYFERDIERGQSYRFDIWRGAMGLIQERPLLGYGAGSDTPIDSSIEVVDDWHYYHNTYIATLVDLGLVGGFLHLIILLIAFKVAWQLRGNIAVLLSAYLLFYSCLINITFGEGIISRMNVQWLLMWLPILIIANFEVTQKRNI